METSQKLARLQIDFNKAFAANEQAKAVILKAIEDQNTTFLNLSLAEFRLNAATHELKEKITKSIKRFAKKKKTSR